MNGSNLNGGRLQDQWQQMQQEKMAYAAMQDAQMAYGPGAVLGQIKPHGPLESAITSIAHGLDEAISAMDRLAERLDPVLQPEVPTPVGNSACVGEATLPTSTTVSRLHHLRRTLDGLICRINAVNIRLDT